jgi:hypothetical protein
MSLWYCDYCRKIFNECEIERRLDQPACPACHSVGLLPDGWEVIATWEQEAQAASQESDVPSAL